jgi:hypothetical protein
MENGYQWTINSTTWNHLRMMWQAQPLDLLSLIHAETHHQNTLETSGYRSPAWQILRALQSIIKANVVIGESTITAAPFFDGTGRPSRSFWGPQQGRKVILLESLGPEDQQKCPIELRDDANWVIWFKSKPKEMTTQTFREHGRCILEGKRAKPNQTNDNQEEISGGRHVVRTRSWWKRGDVDACAAQTNMQCWVHQDTIFNCEQVETNMCEAWEHESSKDEMNVEMNIVLRGLERHYWRGTETGWLGCYDFPRRNLGGGWICA